MTIYQKLAAIQGKIQNPKNTADNPFYKSKYAPLPEILEIIRPLNAEQGLAILQYPESRDGMIGVRSVLVTSSSDPNSIPESVDCGFVGIAAAGLDAQKSGAVITYLRRYAIKAIYGIESEDDDANSAVSEPKGKKEEKTGAGTAPRKKGNLSEIKAAYSAATSRAGRDAVIAVANGLTWTAKEVQELQIFFEIEGQKEIPTQAEEELPLAGDHQE